MEVSSRHVEEAERGVDLQESRAPAYPTPRAWPASPEPVFSAGVSSENHVLKPKLEITALTFPPNRP